MDWVTTVAESAVFQHVAVTASACLVMWLYMRSQLQDFREAVMNGDELQLTEKEVSIDMSHQCPLQNLVQNSVSSDRDVEVEAKPLWTLHFTLATPWTQSVPVTWVTSIFSKLTLRVGARGSASVESAVQHC